MNKGTQECLKIAPNVQLVKSSLPRFFTHFIDPIVVLGYPESYGYHEKYTKNCNAVIDLVYDELFDIAEDVLGPVEEIKDYKRISLYTEIYSNLGLLFLVAVCKDWVKVLENNEEMYKKTIEEAELRFELLEANLSDFVEIKFKMKKGKEIQITDRKEVEFFASILRKMKNNGDVDALEIPSTKNLVASFSKTNRQTPKRQIEKTFMKATYLIISDSAKEATKKSRYIAVNKFLRLIGHPLVDDDKDIENTKQTIYRLIKKRTNSK